MIVLCLLFIGYISAFDSLSSYNVDPEKISVSGFSSGGFMAVQLHVAHSDVFKGVGVIAGGPYFCARGNLSIGFKECMAYSSKIDILKLQQLTKYADIISLNAPTENMRNHPVYIFSGKNDKVVLPEVVRATEEYYRAFVNEKNIKTDYSTESGHGFPTMYKGGNCTEENRLLINNCGYDTAYNVLNHIYNITVKPMNSNNNLNGKLIVFNQREFFSNQREYNGLDDEGYIFVPDSCTKEKTVCGLHVSLHGCTQGKELLGDTYPTMSGYNQIAAANNLIILYPQIKADDNYNPKGCFDWWGYSSVLYAMRPGEQIKVIRRIISRLGNV